MSALLQSLIDLRDLLGSNVLFSLGVMLLSGYSLGKLIGKTGLPEITGFIVAGVLIGESVIGILPARMTPSLQIITEVALGLIALTIGSEFAFSKLKRTGAKIAGIVLFQLVIVYLVTLPLVMLAGLELPYALILASIATASSPSVIVAIVQSLRVHGTFIDYLYGVIALLDAGTVILFGVSFSIAAGLLGLTAAGAGPMVLLVGALSEVVFSLVVGIIMGFVLHWSVVRKNRNNEVMLLTLGIAFAFTALAIIYHLSPLLINMTAGAVLINLTPRHHRIFRIIEPITPPLYALFFVLAGSELRLSLLAQPQILILGGAYLVARSVSKYLSTSLGAMMVKAPVQVKQYLGLCMFPQAGVSLGLVLFVQASPVANAMTPEQFAVTGTLVNIILLSVFVNQIIGPPLATFAIKRGITIAE
jgi:Kef-type K+ transport system membrane component KefB